MNMDYVFGEVDVQRIGKQVGLCMECLKPDRTLLAMFSYMPQTKGVFVVLSKYAQKNEISEPDLEEAIKKASKIFTERYIMAQTQVACVNTDIFETDKVFHSDGPDGLRMLTGKTRVIHYDGKGVRHIADNH